MQSVKVVPSTPVTSNDPASHILNGQPGKVMLHKVGSAKQYATKGCGRVCNQAKFPMSDKSAPRKRG
jgi:hypothetical protein